MKYFGLSIIVIFCSVGLLATNDQEMAIPLMPMNDEAAVASAVQIPIVAQAPVPAPVAGNQCSFRTIFAGVTCVTMSVLAGIITPFAVISSQKSERPCISPDEDMTHACHYVSVADCGQCTRWYGTYVSCPSSGTQNGASVLNATRILLDPICGDRAQYCVQKKDCVENGYICDSNYARDTVAWLRRECRESRPEHALSNKTIERNNKRLLKHKPIQKAHKAHR